MALCFSAGCRLQSPSPGARAFSIDGRSPRILRVDEESTFPQTITNDGTLAWNPASVHLSYHWRSLSGEKLPSAIGAPSYGDGIRTEIGSPVAAGGRLRVDGRVLAPPDPGLYWLQWDVVEEGVTWFSEASRAESGHLVVVLPRTVFAPTFSALTAPLPLAVAIAGLLAVGWVERRGRRYGPVFLFASVADVVWAVAATMSKQQFLATEALLEPTRTAYWVMIWTAVVPPLLLLIFAKRRTRALLVFVFASLCAVLVLADATYFRFFGDVLSVPALLGARQTPQLIGTIRSLVAGRLTWLLADLPVAFWLTVRLRRSVVLDERRRRPAMSLAVAAGVLSAIVLGVGVEPVFASAQIEQMFRDRSVMEQLGPFGFHLYDVWVYATRLHLPPSNADVEGALDWFIDSAPRRAGPGSQAFGAARGKNLIVIQVESLQDFVVDYRVGDQWVMPHLRAWRGDALRFADITDQTSEGRTSDAEFATMTSLLPIDHGAAAFQYPTNHYVGLPGVLGEHGYNTFSAVAFAQDFWNRDVVHSRYGFMHSLFEPEFQPGERIGWGLNDRDFLQQMVPRLEQARQPFCGWLITLSLHHPYESFPQAHKELTLGPLENTPFGNYLHAMHYFDEALEEFRQSLAHDGLLDKSVVVVFGDHDAGFPFEPLTFRLLGIGEGEVPWMLADRIPLFVRVPGLTDGVPASVLEAPGGQVDIAPTVLSLLGVDAAGLPWTGRNLLADPADRPVLRPYGDWVDRRHAMIAHGPPASARCVARATGALVDRGECAAEEAYARAARNVSRLVVAADLQAVMREKLADAAR